ncbi:hypothetical protein [Novosphingobium sp. CECT 9465]|uniref:hypothetical protein n=1 Tax=Novosphingobium sp. CECT 9465 TaxID=2829794 RepID=UPI001E353B38|nr:hypothetical protein [Novosphingobium sp. CECT 9465]CAH0497270.1 hypothetical protein NVSP9465_02323 [Novosphingobium sp. CECT 9465]
MSATLDRVMDIVAAQSGTRRDRLTTSSAIDQDVGISGGDVEDLAEALAGEFGEWVWQWPWQRFALLDEGLSLLFPFQFVWQLFTWPIRGSFNNPSPYERLELGHIAKVIEAGHWLEP